MVVVKLINNINQRKVERMKATKQIRRCLTIAAVVFATAVVWFPGSVRAQDKDMKPMKGAEHLMMLNAITTPEQVEALKDGDTVAMACPKCKTIIVEKVTTEKGHIDITKPEEVHLCSGCQTSIVTVEAGKNATRTLKHVCKKCGSDSVFCCATSVEAKPTKGMETNN